MNFDDGAHFDRSFLLVSLRVFHFVCFLNRSREHATSYDLLIRIESSSPLSSVLILIAFLYPQRREPMISLFCVIDGK